MLKLQRFGGLNFYKQKGNYVADESKMDFHTAPQRKGFYAFLEYKIEMYLLGGTNQDLGIKDGKWKVTKLRKFKVDGFIWSHIYIERYKDMVLEKRGSWFKYKTQDLDFLVRKQYAKDLKGARTSLKKHEDESNNYTRFNSPYQHFSKDHLEVFVPHGTKIY